MLYRAKIGKEQGNYTEKTRIDTERRVNAAIVLKSIAEYAERFEYWENNKWKYLGDDLPAVNKNKHHPSIHYKSLPEFMISLARANISQTVRLAILWGLLNATRAVEKGSVCTLCH